MRIIGQISKHRYKRYKLPEPNQKQVEECTRFGINVSSHFCQAKSSFSHLRHHEKYLLSLVFHRFIKYGLVGEILFLHCPNVAMISASRVIFQRSCVLICMYVMY